MAIQSTALTTGNTTVYTSAGNSVVTTMYFCNTSNTSTINFTLYAVPSGSVASLTNMIYNSVLITATDTYVIDTEKLLLSAGDSLVVGTTVAGLSVTLSYMSI